MIQGINGKNRNTSSGNSIHVARSSSAIAPATGSSRARMAKSNGRAGGRGDEAAAAVGGGSASKAGKRNGSGSRRQSGASMKKKTKKRAGRPKTGSKQVPGLLGIPVARDVDDSDYDDSEDESYSPSSHENSSAEDDDHTATRYREASIALSVVSFACAAMGNKTRNTRRGCAKCASSLHFPRPSVAVMPVQDENKSTWEIAGPLLFHQLSLSLAVMPHNFYIIRFFKEVCAERSGAIRICVSQSNKGPGKNESERGRRREKERGREQC